MKKNNNKNKEKKRKEKKITEKKSPIKGPSFPWGRWNRPPPHVGGLLQEFDALPGETVAEALIRAIGWQIWVFDFDLADNCTKELQTNYDEVKAKK